MCREEQFAVLQALDCWMVFATRMNQRVRTGEIASKSALHKKIAPEMWSHQGYLPMESPFNQLHHSYPPVNSCNSTIPSVLPQISALLPLKSPILAHFLCKSCHNKSVIPTWPSLGGSSRRLDPFSCLQWDSYSPSQRWAPVWWNPAL